MEVENREPQDESFPLPPAASSPPFHTERRALSPLKFAVVLLVAEFFGYQIFGGVLAVAFMFLKIIPDMAPAARLATMIAQMLFLLGGSILALKLQGWDVRTTLRIRPVRMSHIALVIVCVIALQFAFQGYLSLQEYLMNTYIIPDSLQPVLKRLEEFIEKMTEQIVTAKTPLEGVFVWIVVAFTPAICEEILFRGVAQHAFERRFRVRWAAVLTGSIFALYHMNPVSFVPLAVLGVFFSIVVWRTDSIFISMAAHLANNSFAVISLYFIGADAKGKEIAVSSAAATDIRLALAGVAVFLLCFLAFWRLSGRKPRSSV